MGEWGLFVSLTESERHLKEFEEHWIKIAEAMEKTELSDNDAIRWKQKFRIDKLQYLLCHDLQSLDSYEIYNRLDDIEHWIEIAILKGKKNFRDNEGIRLKNKYGLVGELYYWLKEIVPK